MGGYLSDIEFYNSMKQDIADGDIVATKITSSTILSAKVNAINNDSTCNIEVILFPNSELKRVSIPSSMSLSDGDMVQIGYSDGDKNRPFIIQKMDFIIDDPVDVVVRSGLSENSVYIADSGNGRIQIFDIDFNFQLEIEV